MLSTQSRPTPSTFAALLAAKKANSVTEQAGGPKHTAQQQHRPYTSQSEGYEVPYVPLPAVKEIEVTDVISSIEPETIHDTSWMSGIGELGIGWTSRLRRSTVIDEVDPNEALDETDEFLGFHVVAW
ncbi:MAG TPA: hypothetical protein VLG36_00500 [Candidatus Chromulinivoraceae bacterium]|nr:hypothetical protein [Candidatus Chromulinivoraceae bacterium]